MKIAVLTSMDLTQFDIKRFATLHIDLPKNCKSTMLSLGLSVLVSKGLPLFESIRLRLL